MWSITRKLSSRSVFHVVDQIEGIHTKTFKQDPERTIRDICSSFGISNTQIPSSSFTLHSSFMVHISIVSVNLILYLRGNSSVYGVVAPTFEQTCDRVIASTIPYFQHFLLDIVFCVIRFRDRESVLPMPEFYSSALLLRFSQGLFMYDQEIIYPGCSWNDVIPSSCPLYPYPNHFSEGPRISGCLVYFTLTQRWTRVTTLVTAFRMPVCLYGPPTIFFFWC